MFFVAITLFLLSYPCILPSVMVSWFKIIIIKYKYLWLLWREVTPQKLDKKWSANIRNANIQSGSGQGPLLSLYSSDYKSGHVPGYFFFMTEFLGSNPVLSVLLTNDCSGLIVWIQCSSDLFCILWMTLIPTGLRNECSPFSMLSSINSPRGSDPHNVYLLWYFSPSMT